MVEGLGPGTKIPRATGQLGLCAATGERPRAAKEGSHAATKAQRSQTDIKKISLQSSWVMTRKTWRLPAHWGLCHSRGWPQVNHCCEPSIFRQAQEFLRCP